MQDVNAGEARPLVPEPLFKTLMRGVPGPATVITAFDQDGSPKGLTMSAVCSVSVSPPLVLVCLDQGSNTLKALKETRSFTINFLTAGAENLALHFASKITSKFDDVPFSRPEAGVGGPILSDYCSAFAGCRVTEYLEAGDHIIVVGEVAEGKVWPDRQSLAYANRQFFETPMAS